MPIQKCNIQGKLGLKYGDSGKCYSGPDAKKKAAKQGQAIEIGRHADTPAKKKAEVEWRKAHRKK